MMIIPLVYELCNPHRAYLRVLGKAVYYALNRRGCPTWTFLFFCAIRPPADDGLLYRELFFLHTKSLSAVPPDMRAGRRCAPLPCSLCTPALNTGNPRFVRTGGLCFTLRPEDFGRGWVLWSSGLAGHAALGGRAMPCSCSPGKPLGAVSARRQYDGNRFCHRQPPFMRN